MGKKKKYKKLRTHLESVIQAYNKNFKTIENDFEALQKRIKELEDSKNDKVENTTIVVKGFCADSVK